MWRTIKAVSQLAVIAMAMYGGVQGAVSYEFALAVALVAYLGAESVEQILAAVGTRAQNLQRETDGGADTAEDDAEDDQTKIPVYQDE